MIARVVEDSLKEVYNILYLFRSAGPSHTIIQKFVKGQQKGGYTLTEHCDCMSRVRFNKPCKHERMLVYQHHGEFFSIEDWNDEIDYLSKFDWARSEWQATKHHPNLDTSLMILPIEVETNWYLAIGESDGKVVYFHNRKFRNN